MSREPGQQDRYVHDRLPAQDQMPRFVLPSHLRGRFPLNCVQPLLIDHLATESATRIAVRSDSIAWRYDELADRAGRLAALLQSGYRIRSGDRVLLRSANSPWLVACWLAIQLCGAIPVTTLSLLRSNELATIVDMARPRLCICEHQLATALSDGISQSTAGAGQSIDILEYGGAAQPAFESDLNSVEPMLDPYPVLSDDIALIGFTSGTTGRPKATVHYHRDVIAVCEIIAMDVLGAGPGDIFVGTAPLAFTFGLGGLLMFPLFVGGCAVLNPRYTPQSLLDALEQHQATICFTVPTFYQRISRLDPLSLTSALRVAVCSGEALPAHVREQWQDQNRIGLTEFLGATEMLHAFIGCSPAARRGDAMGRCFEGYEARIIDNAGGTVATGTPGRLAVRGPTGCRYLDDPRQTDYVQNGWNITGDTCHMDADGFIWFHARSDDMIISSGYNISGIEVEEALLGHPAVAECAVVGEDDAERGQRVAAYVVRRRDTRDDTHGVAIEELQQHVRSMIAPYKYPRSIYFVDALPRSESGKIQRFRLRAF